MKRVYRLLLTILMLCGALYIYCLIIVPVLEPASQYIQHDSSLSVNTKERRLLEMLFNSDDWELKESRHITINNIHLFIGKYEIAKNGEIKVDKCTIVIVNTDSSLRTPERYRRSIVVRCSGEAILQFERPLSQGNFNASNSFRGGILKGKIHVFCSGDPNTNDDNLDIQTHDVHINANRMWTTANVIFSYGRSHGIGTGLQIQFLNNKTPHNLGKKREGHEFNIDKLSLQKLQSLTFYFPNKNANYKPGELNDPNIPFVMRCDGSFVFNLLNKKATFNDNVVLTRQTPNNDGETITCESLNLQFDNPPQENVPKNQGKTGISDNSNEISAPSEWNLTLKYVEAIGKEVKLIAPKYQLSIDTSRLTVRFIPKLVLEIDSMDTSQSIIQYRNHKLHVNSINYTFPDDGSIGRVECNSNGWFSSSLEDQQTIFRVRWKERLELDINPHEVSEHLLSLKGDVFLELIQNSRNVASLSADSIYLLVKRMKNAVSSTPNQQIQSGIVKQDFQLKRMVANNNVAIKTKQLTAQFDKLQLWFKYQDTSDSANPATQPSSPTKSNQKLNLLSTGSNEDKDSNVHYFVASNVLQGSLVFDKDGYTLPELILNNNVSVTMNNLSTNASPSFEMTGNLIEIHDVTKPTMSAKLIGELAQVKYENMSITGAAINVNCGTNTIWMDGSGEFMLHSLKGNSLSNNVESPSEADIMPTGISPPQNPQPDSLKDNISLTADNSANAKIQWSDSVKVQGRRITFMGNVKMDRDTLYGQCETLDIQLSKEIDLRNNTNIVNPTANMSQSFELQNITLSNSVMLENSTYEDVQKVAQDTLYASILTLNMSTKEFRATGPGRAMTQRMGQPINVNMPFPKTSTPQNKSTDPSDKTRLMHLHVNFQKELTGSFNTAKPMTFHFSGRVDSFYGPINNIGEACEIYDITKATPETILLKCDDMEIRTDTNPLEQNSNLPSASKNKNLPQLSKNFYFVASGGVTLENVVYSIKAERISYEAKNYLMKIEGNGQRPAQFFYQKIPGGRSYQFSSSNIDYNTNTGSVHGTGIENVTLFFEQTENEGNK